MYTGIFVVKAIRAGGKGDHERIVKVMLNVASESQETQTYGWVAAPVANAMRQEIPGLIFVALVIAAFLSWYLMNEWLNTFAYRVQVGAGIFVLVGALSIGLALLTVSWQSIRAALMNPVDNLRSE